MDQLGADQEEISSLLLVNNVELTVELKVSGRKKKTHFANVKRKIQQAKR